MSEKIVVFKNPILEALTHVNPWTPLLLWGPTSAFLIWKSFAINDVSLMSFIITSLSALFVWTFIEYAMHRYLFHFPAKSQFSKRMVFIFHGLHHDDPKDATRLVMPPAPALIYIVIFYFIFTTILGDVLGEVFLASFIIGYLIYDYIHFATHHFKPRTAVGKYLRKHHLQHHSTYHDAKYGVSSPLWDIIFKTMGKRPTVNAK